MSDKLDAPKVATTAHDTAALPESPVNAYRRSLLKGAAAVAGVAGTQAITGFPLIWSQEIKDIELRHVGVSYSVVKAIGDQASKDLGFKVTMQNLDTSAAINRFVTQPNFCVARSDSLAPIHSPLSFANRKTLKTKHFFARQSHLPILLSKVFREAIDYRSCGAGQ